MGFLGFNWGKKKKTDKVSVINTLDDLENFNDSNIDEMIKIRKIVLSLNSRVRKGLINKLDCQVMSDCINIVDSAVKEYKNAKTLIDNGQAFTGVEGEMYARAIHDLLMDVGSKSVIGTGIDFTTSLGHVIDYATNNDYVHAIRSYENAVNDIKSHVEMIEGLKHHLDELNKIYIKK